MFLCTVFSVLSSTVDHANSFTSHYPSLRGMEAVHPAIFPLTEDDHAAWVVIIAVTFFIYTFGAVTTKLSVRYKAAGWRPNDTVLAVGLLILFVQSIFVVTSCTTGLGKHQDSVTLEDLDKFDRVCSSFCFELSST